VPVTLGRRPRRESPADIYQIPVAVRRKEKEEGGREKQEGERRGEGEGGREGREVPSLVPTQVPLCIHGEIKRMRLVGMRGKI
jgi:hypothetical protein